MWVSENARNKLLGLKDMTEEELEQMAGIFTKIVQQRCRAVGITKALDELAGR